MRSNPFCDMCDKHSGLSPNARAHTRIGAYSDDTSHMSQIRTCPNISVG
jgi:hypothetical protein